MVSAIVGTVGSLCKAGSSFGNSNTSTSDAVMGAIDGLINGTLTIIGAVMTYMGTKEEKEMLKKQLEHAQNSESEDVKNTNALVGNPMI